MDHGSCDKPFDGSDLFWERAHLDEQLGQKVARDMSIPASDDFQTYWTASSSKGPGSGDLR